MKINIFIGDDLLSEAMKVSGVKTQKEAIELGSATLVKSKKQENIRQFRGRLKWEGDLETIRLD